MPHIEIKCFPRELTDEQKQNLADDICSVIKQHFGSTDSALSVGLKMVDQTAWKAEVWDKQILAEKACLIKQPGYDM